MLGGPRPGLGRRGRAAPRDRCPALGRSPRGAAALRRSPPAPWQRCRRAPRRCPQLLPLDRLCPAFRPRCWGCRLLPARPPAGSAAVPGFGIPAGRPGVVTQQLGTHRRLAADRKIKREALNAAPRAAAGRGDGVGILVR